MTPLQAVNKTTASVLAKDLLPQVDRARGLMFRRRLGIEQGIWMDMDCTTRALSSIHMVFVFFPISVFWLDRNGIIVDKKLARPFRFFYLPRRPARFVLELHASKFDCARIGDALHLVASSMEPSE
jgi:uncharacterized membrane protein (UPF0127 family)